MADDKKSPHAEPDHTAGDGDDSLGGSIDRLEVLVDEARLEIDKMRSRGLELPRNVALPLLTERLHDVDPMLFAAAAGENATSLEAEQDAGVTVGADGHEGAVAADAILDAPPNGLPETASTRPHDASQHMIESVPAPQQLTPRPMDKTYDPHAIEQQRYEHWERAGYFSPTGIGRPYCIMLPPPNVTGSLHMGHAFQDTLMDALIRYHRMMGRDTLWQCGTDHAGIATQMVVERQLARHGQSRHDLGREAFVEAVWQWKAESGGTITRQLRRMGASMDWQRERFTLDPALSLAVTEVFVTLFEEGLIYRGKRLVNWDPVLHTAISDLEVISEEENGKLWHLRYPLADGTGEVVVATTRPETMLGDVAVAVHPEDLRYQRIIGREVELPLCNRNIPIIADSYVNPEFGSGCVKITPAHDFNDFAMGERHGFEPLNIFTDDAAINDAAPAAYRGLDRFDARAQIVADLQARNLLVKVDDHKLTIPRGDRTAAIIEPYLTDQWYVRAAPLAAPAIKAVEEGRLRFVPDNWTKTYFEWMRNIEDWCISRQLWWGHRIPAWYDPDGGMHVGRSEAEARAKSQLSAEVPLRQDPDVLDTWFSSALWPFSTLGWPQPSPELERYYPTSVLVTGFDIIFFWVARMVMMGLKFMRDLPFEEVYIHGLVRDADGQKMSKSKGNILDPIDLIDGVELEPLVAKRTTGLMRPEDAEKIAAATRRQYPRGIPSYGTDALRFTFASMATQGRDIRFDLGRIEGYRNFCNKIWNASRYVLMTVNEPLDLESTIEFGMPEHWIQSRLEEMLLSVHQGLRQYRFDIASQALYEFIWDDYCDWYIELAKVTLNDPRVSEARKLGTRRCLTEVLEASLRAMHPLMPFISEEIWLRIAPLLGREADSIMLQAYPQASDGEPQSSYIDSFEWIREFILGVRRIRSENDVEPKLELVVSVQGGSVAEREWLERYDGYIKKLARLERIERADYEAIGDAATAVVGETTALVPLLDIIDPLVERERLNKEIAKQMADLERTQGKLANQNFLAKAPAEVVEKERRKLADLESSIARLQDRLKRFEALSGARMQ